jgi:hypothetical protein
VRLTESTSPAGALLPHHAVWELRYWIREIDAKGGYAATVLGGLRERLRPYSRFFPPQVVFRFYERTGTVLALSFFRGLKLASFTVGKPLDKNDSEEDALYPVLRDGDPVGEPVRGKKAAASRAAYLKQKDLIAFLRKQKKTSAVDYNRSLNRLRGEFFRLGEQRRTGIIAPKVRSIDSEPTLK